MENNIEAKARLNNHRGSARKARLVLDLIRGKQVNIAKNILQFSTKRAARSIAKLLNSAIANATQVAGKTDLSNMVVDKAWANEGKIMRRYMPSIKGSAKPIRKRTCHITIGIAGTK
jgi:large subunit ribosomal protein L22